MVELTQSYSPAKSYLSRGPELLRIGFAVFRVTSYLEKHNSVKHRVISANRNDCSSTVQLGVICNVGTKTVVRSNADLAAHNSRSRSDVPKVKRDLIRTFFFPAIRLQPMTNLGTTDGFFIGSERIFGTLDLGIHLDLEERLSRRGRFHHASKRSPARAGPVLYLLLESAIGPR